MAFYYVNLIDLKTKLAIIFNDFEMYGTMCVYIRGHLHKIWSFNTDGYVTVVGS